MSINAVSSPHPSPEENVLRRVQRRHDGNIRRTDSGSELARFFGVDLAGISHFGISVYRKFDHDSNAPDVKVPSDVLSVNCRAVFDEAVGFEVRSVDIARIEFSETHGTYSFTAMEDGPLSGDQIWELLEMHREIDEILLINPQGTLPASQ